MVGAGGSRQTLRALGAVGPGAEGAVEWAERGKEERKTGLLRASSVPSPTSHNSHPGPPSGMCTCKEERVPSLTLVPGCKGFGPLDAPGCLRRPELTSSPGLLPALRQQGFAGLWCHEGLVIALYIW